MSAYKEFTDCKYRKNINCPEECRRCDKCGWNPKVAARRLEKIRKEREGTA